MAGDTKFRDSWADAKQADLPQTFQATANFASEARRNLIELDRLFQEAGRATSHREFYAAIERLTQVSRAISHNVHSMKFLFDFQISPATLFTDHFLNQFYFMSALKRTWWVEGPAFCGLAIKPGARILELGCGTGYYTDIFFSPFAADIVAIDIDPRAIETARRMHQASNIRYETMDFREKLPEGPFDVVVWTPTIVAYTPADVHTMMGRLRQNMSKHALLCGWTAVESDHDGEDVLWYDLKSLANRLNRYFENIRAFERIHTTVQPPRHEMYFYASDGPLPFDNEWPHHVRLDIRSRSSA